MHLAFHPFSLRTRTCAALCTLGCCLLSLSISLLVLCTSLLCTFASRSEAWWGRGCPFRKPCHSSASTAHRRLKGPGCLRAFT